MTRYDEHCDALSTAADALRLVLDTTDLTTPVPTCPGWTVSDLGEHVTDVHRWALSELVGTPPDPLPAGPVAERFARGAAELTEALASRDADAGCRAIYPPDTAATWARRQALETAIHLWDATHAVGAATRLPADLAADGVREVFDDLYPRQVRLGRVTPVTDSVLVRFSDAHGGAHLGGGAPDAVVTAPAHDVLLLLWGRIGPDQLDAEVDGDEAALRRILDTALVP